MQNKFCVIFFERKIQGSASAGSYISLEEVILNKSLTRRKANITAVRQSLSSLDEYHKSVRIYLVAESLVGTRLMHGGFLILIQCSWQVVSRLDTLLTVLLWEED